MPVATWLLVAMAKLPRLTRLRAGVTQHLLPRPPPQVSMFLVSDVPSKASVETGKSCCMVPFSPVIRLMTGSHDVTAAREK